MSFMVGHAPATGPQAPSSGRLWVGETAWPPYRALHLKEISWDHQKPAALIAGILFLVSLDELLQVLGVISLGPGCRSLSHHCVPGPASLPRGPGE